MNLFANMMSGLMKCTCGASVFYDEVWKLMVWHIHVGIASRQ